MQQTLANPTHISEVVSFLKAVFVKFVVSKYEIFNNTLFDFSTF
ncbi:hypothetical protein [Cytobacillus sp.]|nr:hypothetical protein [Cytobacillus sp.]